MRCRFCECLFLIAGSLWMTGCSMVAPIHVWQPPELQSTVGKRVVLTTVAGPEDVAGPIKQTLIDRAPHDVGRTTTIVDAVSLQSQSQVRLASASNDEPNDLATAAVAREVGADFLLRGELIENRRRIPDRTPPDLKLSWRLTSLDGTQRVTGMPVVVDVESAIDRYSDLALVTDPKMILVSAAVRDTYRLLTPSVRRDQVRLAITYLLPGSQQLRRGNLEALAGRWGEAESIWRDVLEQHPSQLAALHNLAVAAAAGQRFSQAKQMARKAVRLQPTPLHERTLVWIELKQRDYHRAFGLPDPPEGWYVTQDTAGAQ